LEKQRKNFFDGSSKSGDSDIVNIVIGSNVNDIANIIKEDFSEIISSPIMVSFPTARLMVTLTVSIPELLVIVTVS
jgi:hypothetical protein